MVHEGRKRKRRVRDYLWSAGRGLFRGLGDTGNEADMRGGQTGSLPSTRTSSANNDGNHDLTHVNMNPYPSSQPTSRPGPRLQNTQKSALGNGTGGWAGFGMPSSGSAAGFGGLGAASGAGAGAAPGLAGPGRPGQLSGFAQVMGGGGSQGPIDMSDFPSLSGGPRAQQQTNAPAAGWNSTAIRQPSAQAQQQQPPPTQQRAPSTAPSQQSIEQYDSQRSQHASGDRADDFPPLGGQANGDSYTQPNGFGSSYDSPVGQQARSTSNTTQIPIREGSGAYAHSQAAALGQQHAQPHHQQTAANGPPPQSTSGVKKYGDLTESEKWGLQGLMAAFESRKQVENGGQPDETLPPGLRSTCIMGHDLDSLGLNLESPDPIYPTFNPFTAVGSSGSAFDYHDRLVVPDFTLPSAYTVTNVPALGSRMSAFSDETLFTIFYQHPRDVLQDLAAQELVTRDWRWHKILRQWLTKDSRESHSASSHLPLVDLTNGAPVAQPPVRKSERVEQGVYVFFDAMNWRRERRFLDLDYDSLDPGRGGPVNGGGVAVGMNGGGGVGAANAGGQMAIAGAGAAGLGPAGSIPGPGRLMTHGQQSGIGSSQIPSA